MGAPLSSGIGTGAAQVYSGTMAYDALRDIIQQQRIQREKKEAKEEKKQLKAEKEQKEQDAYIRNELRGIIPRDAKIFGSRDREKITTDLMGRAEGMLSEPGFAKRLHEGDIDATVRWEEFMGEASGIIQKSVDDKAHASIIQQEYDRYKADPEKYDGEFYPEDLERFGTESTTALSNISALDKRIDYNKTLDEYIANQWQLWSSIQKEEQGTSKKGWSMTDPKAAGIIDNFYNDPTNVKALRHKIKASEPQLSDEEVDAKILQEREQQLADVKKWTTEQKIYRSSGIGNTASQMAKLQQNERTNAWITKNITPGLSTSTSIANTEQEHLKHKLVIPKRDVEGNIVYQGEGNTKPQRTTLVAASYPEFDKYEIQTSTPQFEQVKKSLQSSTSYSKEDLIFPIKDSQGNMYIGVVYKNGQSYVTTLDNEMEIILQSKYVENIKGSSSGGSFDPNAY